MAKEFINSKQGIYKKENLKMDRGMVKAITSIKMDEYGVVFGPIIIRQKMENILMKIRQKMEKILMKIIVIHK